MRGTGSLQCCWALTLQKCSWPMAGMRLGQLNGLPQKLRSREWSSTTLDTTFGQAREKVGSVCCVDGLKAGHAALSLNAAGRLWPHCPGASAWLVVMLSRAGSKSRTSIASTHGRLLLGLPLQTFSNFLLWRQGQPSYAHRNMTLCTRKRVVKCKFEVVWINFLRRSCMSDALGSEM